ncbi:MAG: SpoVR family protein [Gammaproteobacteria bacterium]
MTGPGGYHVQIESLARDLGLDFFPIEVEVVPPSFMMEVAVYGLPVRMPHWSFGLRYIYQLVQHRMGYSRIFEVVFPGNPGRAYLANTNTPQENNLVLAHVLGHADFSKHNLLFQRAQQQVGFHVVELAAAHAHHIDQAIARHGQQRVEAVLDAALALEQHIDEHRPLARAPYPQTEPPAEPHRVAGFQKRFQALPGEDELQASTLEHVRVSLPPHPELDLLWLIAHYAPELEDWERDIFLAVREESFYFHPVFSCHIMNEGWASYWHARLLREARFLPSTDYLDALKSHSDVVRPYASDNQVALSINPYHLGFVMWDRMIEAHGLEKARRIMCEEDDFSFIHNYLDAELARDLGLFAFISKRNGEVRVADWSIESVQENILAQRYHFGAPRIAAARIGIDGSLDLQHDHLADGRGLDLEYARKVLGYIQSIWRRPVVLNTVDSRERDIVLKVGGPS